MSSTLGHSYILAEVDVEQGRIWDTYINVLALSNHSVSIFVVILY